MPPLTSTPCLAAPASADTIDTGVEITSAHGHDTTSNTSARYSQISNDWFATTSGTAATSAASTTMAGVYQAANRSMNVCRGARLACADSTRLTMRASVVSWRRRVTATVS